MKPMPVQQALHENLTTSKITHNNSCSVFRFEMYELIYRVFISMTSRNNFLSPPAIMFLTFYSFLILSSLSLC
jgi:hypothetical protein